LAVSLPPRPQVWASNGSFLCCYGLTMVSGFAPNRPIFNGLLGYLVHRSRGRHRISPIFRC